MYFFHIGNAILQVDFDRFQESPVKQQAEPEQKKSKSV